MSNKSATLNAQKIVNDRREKNLPVYNFGLGANPLPVHPKYSELLKKYSDKKEYTSVSGIPKLEKAIKNVYTINNYKVENVLFGNGLKELLFLVQMVFNGVIYHITPAYVSYEKQINSLNKRDKFIQIPTTYENKFKLKPQDLIKYLDKNINEPKLILFNNPTNPTGVIYTSEELEELSNIFRKYNCVILSDEIYMNLCYDYTCSLSQFIPERVIVGSSVSKDFACSGYRLGWITFPKELNNLFNSCFGVASNMYSCPNVPVQYATAELFNNFDLCAEICIDTREIFSEIVDRVCGILKQTKLRFVKPKAAWYLFIDFSEYSEFLFNKGVTNSFELSDFLINEKGIVGVPGKSFGIDGLFMRFSLVDFNFSGVEDRSKNIIEGIKELVNIFI